MSRYFRTVARNPAVPRGRMGGPIGALSISVRWLYRKPHQGFSRNDYAHILGSSRYWVKHHYRVGMVLTITLLGRKSARQTRMLGTRIIELTFDNYRLFFTGYVSMLDEDEEDTKIAYDDEVILL